MTRSESCENTQPTIRDTGEALTFRSTCDLVAGHNPAGVPQVFYYELVDDDDVRATAGGCEVADGCCNEANGCLVHLFGRKLGPPKEMIRPDFTN